jgi:hypothetical protein
MIIHDTTSLVVIHSNLVLVVDDSAKHLPLSDLPQSSHIIDPIRGMIRRRDIRPARQSR